MGLLSVDTPGTYDMADSQTYLRQTQSLHVSVCYLCCSLGTVLKHTQHKLTTQLTDTVPPPPPPRTWRRSVVAPAAHLLGWPPYQTVSPLLPFTVAPEQMRGCVPSVAGVQCTNTGRSNMGCIACLAYPRGVLAQYAKLVTCASVGASLS